MAKIERMEELAEAITKDAEDGVDFGCRCYYCGCDPAELVSRGDCIPIIYGGDDRRQYCFSCSDGGYYACTSHIKDRKKELECLLAFRGGAMADRFYEKCEKELEALNA